MYLLSPNNTLITGTLENLAGVSFTVNDTFRKEDGKITYDFQGKTEIHWNGAETVRRYGQVVFVDDGGGEYLEKDCRLVTAAQIKRIQDAPKRAVPGRAAHRPRNCAD